MLWNWWSVVQRAIYVGVFRFDVRQRLERAGMCRSSQAASVRLPDVWPPTSAESGFQCPIKSGLNTNREGIKMLNGQKKNKKRHCWFLIEVDMRVPVIPTSVVISMCNYSRRPTYL